MASDPRRPMRFVAIGLLFLSGQPFLPMDRSNAAAGRRNFDPARAEELIGYARSIVLSPSQQQMRDRVLDGISAPCCAKFSARTCCCACNLAKTIWGLSNVLIVREGAGPAALEKAVRGWLAALNPKGFSGKACDEAGGCARKFSRDGCGGMDERNLVAAR